MQGQMPRIGGAARYDSARREGDAFAARAVQIGGHELVADRSGVLYWPAERLIAVADLHLEKGSAFAQRGSMLPPYDTRETLARLAEAVARFEPSTVVALGDSLHDRGGADRLGAAERAELVRLQTGRSWIWLRGNHDPDIGPAVGGEAMDALSIGGVRMRHEPRGTDAGGAPADEAEIAGHLHPAARVRLGPISYRGRCFVGDARRLVLPAFGALTGGLNVLDGAIAGLFAGGAGTVLLLGERGVYPVAPALLEPDRS